MNDDHVGRLLAAAIHQAISDELPTRIDFYEHWLRGERMRDGGVGLAPMTAVMGFLRAEGPPYHSVMAHAGRCAADWTSEAMPSFRRRLFMAMPRWWRSRAVLGLAATAIRQGYGPSRAVVQVRRGLARIEIRHSLFCRVRESQAAAQCDFHAAMIMGLLASFGLPGTFEIERCTGSGGSMCVIAVDLNMVAPSMEAHS